MLFSSSVFPLSAISLVGASLFFSWVSFMETRTRSSRLLSSCVVGSMFRVHGTGLEGENGREKAKGTRRLPRNPLTSEDDGGGGSGGAVGNGSPPISSFLSSSCSFWVSFSFSVPTVSSSTASAGRFPRAMPFSVSTTVSSSLRCRGTEPSVALERIVGLASFGVEDVNSVVLEVHREKCHTGEPAGVDEAHAVDVPPPPPPPPRVCSFTTSRSGACRRVRHSGFLCTSCTFFSVVWCPFSSPFLLDLPDVGSHASGVVSSLCGMAVGFSSLPLSYDMMGEA